MSQMSIFIIISQEIPDIDHKELFFNLSMLVHYKYYKVQMSFILKMLGIHTKQPSKNQNQYDFPYNGNPMQVMPGQTVQIPLQYQLNSLPENTCFELRPHQDMIKKGFTGVTRNIQSNDTLFPLSFGLKLGRKQQPQRIDGSDNIVHGILRSVFDDAMQILPFAVTEEKDMIQKKELFTIQEQKNMKQQKAPLPKKKIIKKI